MPRDSLPERLNGKLGSLFFVLVFAYAVITGFGPMMNQVDLGWQVAQGRWTVQHAAPYLHDAFNYPNLGRPVINEYPLFEIILYTAWSLGWWGPCLLTAAAYGTLLAILYGHARKSGLGASPLFAMAVGLMLAFFLIAFPLRPHLATYLGVTALGVFLLRHRDAEKWTVFWPMALLQVVWTNCHSGFVLGPAMVALFGPEMVVRRWIRARSFPWATARTWLFAFLLMLLACLFNPNGWARFYPPFFQDRLESIRAYVGEMEPLTDGLATICHGLTMIAVVVVATAALRRRAVCWSFLLLALALYQQAQEVNKAWPVFGLCLPLLVLGSGTFSTVAPRPAGWSGAFVSFIAAVLAAMALFARLDGTMSSSVPHQWREFDASRTELPVEATAWLQANHIQGRLFHRCEDGGWLQMSGYDHGETFSDTGFGKFDPAFIHEIGLVNERPALVPRYLAAYRPDFVVCGNFCFQWPYYLRQNGWRPVFYSPNSSVWTRTETRPDLPTVSDTDIMAAFDRDLAVHGMPDARLLGRNVLALNSLGLEDFAFAKLTGLPEEFHHAPWYWEAARFLCFAAPPFSAAHRDALMGEAEALHDDALTGEFRAYGHYNAGDSDGARAILRNIPPRRLGNYAAELLLRIELDRHDPGALALARRTDCFDLRNGHHWQYLAEVEERAGNIEPAKTAWAKAVFYYPDDPGLMQTASAFAEKYNDASLAQAITDSGRVYGATASP